MFGMVVHLTRGHDDQYGVVDGTERACVPSLAVISHPACLRFSIQFFVVIIHGGWIFFLYHQARGHGTSR